MYSERSNQKSEKYSTLDEMKKFKKSGNNFLSSMNEAKNSNKNLDLFDRKISTFKILGEKKIKNSFMELSFLFCLFEICSFARHLVFLWFYLIFWTKFLLIALDQFTFFLLFGKFYLEISNPEILSKWRANRASEFVGTQEHSLVPSARRWEKWRCCFLYSLPSMCGRLQASLFFLNCGSHSAFLVVVLMWELVTTRTSISRQRIVQFSVIIYFHFNFALSINCISFSCDLFQIFVFHISSLISFFRPTFLSRDIEHDNNFIPAGKSKTSHKKTEYKNTKKPENTKSKITDLTGKIPFLEPIERRALKLETKELKESLEMLLVELDKTEADVEKQKLRIAFRKKTKHYEL